MSDYMSETALTAASIGKAVTFIKNFERGVAILQAVMAKSDAHALFVARKLMCDEILTGAKVRRLAVMPKALVLDPGETLWFPLPVGDTDRVIIRVKHVVNTVCRWYADANEMSQHLTEVLTTSGGQVSWIWVELAAMLVHFDIPVVFKCATAEEGQVLQARVLATQTATQEPLLRYLRVLHACQIPAAEPAPLPPLGTPEQLPEPTEPTPPTPTEKSVCEEVT
jgi:hypothetical protein